MEPDCNSPTLRRWSLLTCPERKPRLDLPGAARGGVVLMGWHFGVGLFPGQDSIHLVITRGRSEETMPFVNLHESRVKLV